MTLHDLLTTKFEDMLKRKHRTLPQVNTGFFDRYAKQQPASNTKASKIIGISNKYIHEWGRYCIG